MNIWIVLLLVATLIVSPMGGFGILTGLFLIYFVLSDKKGREYIRAKFKVWSWTDWRV